MYETKSTATNVGLEPEETKGVYNEPINSPDIKQTQATSAHPSGVFFLGLKDP